jgi:hypothetical protein
VKRKNGEGEVSIPTHRKKRDEWGTPFLNKWMNHFEEYKKSLEPGEEKVP